jgi:hypothetical protein
MHIHIRMYGAVFIGSDPRKCWEIDEETGSVSDELPYSISRI